MENQELNIFYMRDNHTFRKLSINVESALFEIQQELDDGFTCGGLVCKNVAAPQQIVHCDYQNVEKFKQEVKEWYKKLYENYSQHYAI